VREMVFVEHKKCRQHAEQSTETKRACLEKFVFYGVVGLLETCDR